MIVIGQQSTLQVVFKIVSFYLFCSLYCPSQHRVARASSLSSSLAIKVFYYPVVLKMQRMGKVRLLIGITNIPTLF